MSTTVLLELTIATKSDLSLPTSNRLLPFARIRTTFLLPLESHLLLPPLISMSINEELVVLVISTENALWLSLYNQSVLPPLEQLRDLAVNALPTQIAVLAQPETEEPIVWLMEDVDLALPTLIAELEQPKMEEKLLHKPNAML